MYAVFRSSIVYVRLFNVVYIFLWFVVSSFRYVYEYQEDATLLPG